MRTPTGTVRGFSLVEVSIALGIAAFALMALIGTLPVGLGTHHAARNETAGINVISSLGASIRAASDVFNGGTLPESFELRPARSGQTPPVIPLANDEAFDAVFYVSAGGEFGVDPGEAAYRLTVNLAPKTAESRRTMHLLLSWPPPVDPFEPGAASAGKVETVITIPSR